MPSNCAVRNDGTYAVRHNPWTYFADPAERAACQRFDVPSGSPTDGPLAEDIAGGELPNIGLLIPDDCNNGHDCSIDTTDQLAPVVAAHHQGRPRLPIRPPRRPHHLG